MLHCGGYTDLGKTRPINEDGYYLSEYNKELDALYVMVADGMGGHQAGEIASTMAVQQVSEVINKNFTAGMDVPEVKELLVKAVKSANHVIFEQGRENEERRGMGTTLTLCFVLGNKAIVAHVGDSRAYLLRQDAWHQITSDHSLVQELLRNGQITEEEAIHHPQKNVITRALGTDFGVEIDIYEFTIYEGDILLLCTDGLSNMLSDERLKELIKQNYGCSLDRLSEQLVTAANEEGGYDNITAVLLAKESELY